MTQMHADKTIESIKIYPHGVSCTIGGHGSR